MTALQLFDALCPGPSWRPWRVFIASVNGEPLTAEDLATFQRHTGRTAPRVGGYPEAVCVVGVQSGKTRIAAVLADHAALTGEPGTHALLVSQDHRAAMRALLRYARQPFETIDAFRAEVARDTADSLDLKRGTTLSAYPCRPSAIRGLRASIVAVDELAFFQSSDGRPTDVEMLRAARGRVATTGGKLVVLSSPYAATGALYELHRKHYAREDSAILVWQAASPDMNPTLPADYLRRMADDDPEAYRSEVLGEFRSGVTAFLDPALLAYSVANGVHEVAPRTGVAYVAFADAASGSGKDAFTVAVAHSEGERVLLDCCRAWEPPFNPSGVIAEVADVLRSYRVGTVTGDRYAAGFVQEGFRANSITYRSSERDRSALFLELLPLVNSGRAVLLDDKDLLRELRGLERRRGTSGRDRIDHAPGQHDDRANAAAGAVVLAAADAAQQPFGLLFSGGSPSEVATLEATVEALRARLAGGTRAVVASLRAAGASLAHTAQRTAARLKGWTPQQKAARQAEAARLREWRNATRAALAQREAAAIQALQVATERDGQQRAAVLRSQARVLHAVARHGWFWPGEDD